MASARDNCFGGHFAKLDFADSPPVKGMRQRPAQGHSPVHMARFELPASDAARRAEGRSLFPAVRHIILAMLVVGVGLFCPHASHAQSSASHYGISGTWRFAGSGVINVPPSCNPPGVFSYSTDVGALEASALAMGGQCQSALNLTLQQLGQDPMHCEGAPYQLVPVNTPGPFQETSGTTFNNVQYASYSAESNTGSVSCMAAEVAAALLGDAVQIWTCPVGQVPNFFGGAESCAASLAPYFFLVLPDSVPPPAGPSDGSATNQGSAETPEPINPATGNESLSETDYRSGDGRLNVTRTYNSNDLNVNSIGNGWRTNFLDRSLVATALVGSMPANTVSTPFADPGTACTQGWAGLAANIPGQTNVTATWNGSSCVLSSGTSLTVYSSQPTSQTSNVGISAQQSDGSAFPFSCAATACTAAASVALMLAPQAGGGYVLTDEKDSVETYNAKGQLLSITARGGYQQTLTYTSGLVSSVSDSFGRKLTFQYNSRGFLQSVTTPSGQIQYAYNSSGTLASVTYPDQTLRKYTYGNAQSPNQLTGITDESGAAYASIGYDSSNRATSSSLSGNAWSSAVTYSVVNAPVVTDAFGVARTYQYASIHGRPKLQAISGSPCNICGAPASQTFDAAGFITSRTDYNGNLTCYASDPIRGVELVRVEGFASGSACPADLATYIPAANTLQRKISTTWDAAFRIPLSITAPNRTITFAPDSSGNVLTKTITDTSVTPNVARAWTYTYDSFGHVLTVDGPRTDVVDKTTYAYYTCTTGSQCGQLETITDALGHVTTINTYNSSGQPLTITDSNGVVTTLIYDARERLTSTSVGTETTSYSYYPTGQVKLVTLPDSSTMLYAYDAAHRLTDITDGLGNHIHYTLDAMGNRTAVNTYDPTSVLRRTHTRVFNTLNQLQKDVNAAGTAAVTTAFVYDLNGNPTSIEAPLSRNTTNAYDALNRLDKITDAANGITVLGYDSNDHVASAKDPRNLTTTYIHNGFNQVTQVSSPDTGASTKTFDSGGNLHTTTDARGAVATYTYDALNRVTKIAYTDQTIQFAYDAGTNGKGRLTGASDTNHSMSWTYDTHGRVTGKGQTVDLVTKAVGYTYTNADLTSLVTPSGQTITYGYSNHRITSIKVGSTTLLSGVTYFPFGSVGGWSWGNASTVSRTYNTDGNVSQIATAGDVLTFGYDNALRIDSLSDMLFSPNGYTAGYDALDRLNSLTQIGVTSNWTFDADGNHLTQTGTSTVTTTPSTTSNRVSSISGSIARTYAYDAAGNTLSYTGASFGFSQRGRMKSATVGSTGASYIYNALGQLIQKTVGSVTTLLMYDERGHLLGEYSSTGALIQETVWMDDTPVATLRPNGSSITIYYVHTDHVNAPRIVTQSTDNSIRWLWGGNAANQNPLGLGTFNYNLRYPGQYFQAETGLSYNYFRDYDGITGRYLESDPIGLIGGINTYVYANANPISRIDPLGLLNVVVTAGGSFVTGLGAEGFVGIYITLPSPGNNFDIGVFGSAGIGGGWEYGVANQYGIVTGNEGDIKGITIDANGSGGIASGSIMFDQNGEPVGAMVGPAAELGGSVMLSETHAIGLNDLGSWLGGLMYDLVHPSSSPACP